MATEAALAAAAGRLARQRRGAAGVGAEEDKDRSDK
jgi:hypothetical protein